MEGLSPPTRGSRRRRCLIDCETRSGVYPRPRGGASVVIGVPIGWVYRVYPRPRGGAFLAGCGPDCILIVGLSPPTRGSRYARSLIHDGRVADGSIPAHAGEPAGYVSLNRQPRDGRSIPAHAGEPCPRPFDGVRGPQGGLSPPTRGSRLSTGPRTKSAHRGLSPPTRGSHTALRARRAWLMRVYPRPRGGALVGPPILNVHPTWVYPRPRGGAGAYPLWRSHAACPSRGSHWP